MAASFRSIEQISYRSTRTSFGSGEKYKFAFYRLNLETMRLERYDDLQSGQIAWRASRERTDRLPSSVLKKNEGVFSAAWNGNYLAGEVRRGKHLEGKPERIILYDLAQNKPVCSQSLTEPGSFWPDTRLYAVSSDGSLALIQNNRLTVWKR